MRNRMIPHSRPHLGREEIEAVRKILDSGHPGPGEETAAFERAVAERAGQKQAVAVQTGSAALHLALLALGIDHRHEIILPSYTCAAVLHAVHYTGARPRFVDIDPDTLAPCPADIRKKTNRKTGAVIFTHMLGRLGPVWDVLPLGIPVIEDCAMALGAKGAAGPAGSFGTLSIFSFYATKVIATGHGGMVATSSKKLASRLRDLVDYDGRRRYEVRFNYRMSNLAAAVGRAQCRRLHRMIRQRRRLARNYHQKLDDLPLTLPTAHPGHAHIYYRYMIQLRRGNARLQQHLKQCGIEAKPPVYRPLHRYFGISDRSFPITTMIQRRGLSIPLYPGLKEVEQNRIIRAVRSFF